MLFLDSIQVGWHSHQHILTFFLWLEHRLRLERRRHFLSTMVLALQRPLAFLLVRDSKEQLGQNINIDSTS